MNHEPASVIELLSLVLAFLYLIPLLFTTWERCGVTLISSFVHSTDIDINIGIVNIFSTLCDFNQKIWEIFTSVFRK